MHVCVLFVCIHGSVSIFMLFDFVSSNLKQMQPMHANTPPKKAGFFQLWLLNILYFCCTNEFLVIMYVTEVLVYMYICSVGVRTLLVRTDKGVHTQTWVLGTWAIALHM